MLELISKIFMDQLKGLMIWASRHVFRSIGTSVAVTLFCLFALLNPWFGSSSAKYYVFKYMYGSPSDVEFLLKNSRNDKNLKNIIITGAADAGYFDEGNKKILQSWANSLPDGYSKVINISNLDQDKFAAVLEARRLAFDRRAPFQPIGLKGIASSPTCPKTRPRTGEVYVNSESDFGRQINTGEVVMITRSDGVGRSVIAKVSINPNMDRSTDMYLNRRQLGSGPIKSLA